MLEVLHRKIQQMHAALGSVVSEDFSQAKIVRTATRTSTTLKYTFGPEDDAIQLANSASLLIANIASIKDHLRHWCQEQKIEFSGEKLINNNASVALIHDLWNIDKHGKLTYPPRSGLTPKLLDLKTKMRVRARSSVQIMFVPTADGGWLPQTDGDGTVELGLMGRIVDETGREIAEFLTTCEKAAEAWQQELERSGVPAQQ